ncbi:MAG TPA: hypothetical protein VEX86_04500 [Longimicrobium sp.]|nr:hypothetical protein [Longimicrobium sp.]
MLTGQLGVRLVMMVGDTVPLPAPYELVTAITSVQVTQEAEGNNGFQVTFRVALDSLVDFGLVASGALDPFKRVVIGVITGVVPEVLIDGIITHRQLTPADEPGASTLTVTGKDVSQMMDLEEKNEEYPNQPDFVIAARVIAGYAQYGMIPATMPTADVPIQLQRIPRQAETDYRFLKRMAERNGYVFYVEPVTFGVNNAYWGPEIRAGIPKPALTAGPYGNVKGIHFSHDGLSLVGSSGSFLEPISGTVLPIPPMPPLRVPPLALKPVMPRRTTLARTTSKSNPAQATANVMSAQSSAPDPLTASGEVDTARYGAVLRPRSLVGVRGAGLTHDGMWLVRKVTHTLNPVAGEYKQAFTLSREGTISSVPAVLP